MIQEMIKQEHFSTKPPHPASTPPLSSHSGGGVGGLPYPPPPYLPHSMHPSASSQHNLLHQSHPMDSHLQVALKTLTYFYWLPLGKSQLTTEQSSSLTSASLVFLFASLPFVLLCAALLCYGCTQRARPFCGK